jgi:transketolase
MRMCEQVRTSICYPGLNVKIACSHGGLTPGSDGVTHQAIEDMGIYRTIPGMTVIMPSDYYSTRKLVAASATHNGPVYIRFTRCDMPVFYNENDSFEIGRGKLINQGDDVSIIAIGDMLHQALEAADTLEKMGIDTELIEIHTLKPLDNDMVLKSLRKTKRVVTVENHNYFNGLGSAVAELMAEAGCGILRRIGLKDVFAESGEYYELLKKYEMDKEFIVKAALDLLSGE